METCPRKSFYRNRSIAESYFGERFSSPKGQRENEATLAAVARALDLMPGTKRVLDMPCGSGRFTRFFCDHGYLYFGADISREMMEIFRSDGKARGLSSRLVQCDGENLPFKDNVFDCVVCIRFLNLVPRETRENMLKEMKRVSRKWFIVQSHRLKFMGPFTRLKLWMRKLFGRDISKYQLHQEILDAGWREQRRLRVQHTGHCVGIYEKPQGHDAFT